MRTARFLVIVSMLGTIGTAAPASSPSVADALKRFNVADLDGVRWTADRLHGRVVLLDFWATWCAPCLADLPRLKALRDRHPRSDFEIVGISLDSSNRRTLVSWLNRNRIDWPQIHEARGYNADTSRLFGVDRLPMTILIDRDGTVAAVGLRGERLGARIEKLVGGGPTGAQPR
jgi:thiol-disulfide isomerase/thioredoxin